MSEQAGMREVIELIRNGEWELGYGSGSRNDDGRYWIQQGGLTKGGATKRVSISTITALEKRKLIEIVAREPKQPFWLRRYRYVSTTEPEQKGRVRDE